MILKRIKIMGFRPFFEEQTLEIEPTVTVLTGANDVGKSALLNILKRVAPGMDGNVASEADVNEDMILQSGGPWHAVEDLDVIATYQLGTESDQLELRSGELDTRWPANRHEVNVTDIRDNSGNRVGLERFVPQSYTRTIDLGISDRIKPILEQNTIQPIERTLLEIAFESDDVWSELVSLSPRVQNQRLDVANRRLETGLASYKPKSLDVDLRLDFESRNPVKFLVELKDRYGGFAGPDRRGAGFQKLLAMMFYLLTVQPSDVHYMILLLDEPENSLHANAQHSFRHVLESFAENPLIQVIYATHSPAMINPAFPKRLRLLERKRTGGGVATTVINNKPYTDENFYMIRSSLGMSPADSLLYGPISVIVEGATETLALNRLFRRLMKDPKNDLHRELHRLVGLIHFLGAEGSSFVRWAKMAKSQPGVKPIVFVDGDQINRAKQVTDVYPDIPVINFDKTKEIEDIVPREVYFEALSQYAASNNAKCSVTLSLDEFTKWETGQGFQPSELFSKRVCKWYKEVCAYGLEKAEVMDTAIEKVDLDDLYESNLDEISKIDELIEKIKELADNL